MRRFSRYLAAACAAASLAAPAPAAAQSAAAWYTGVTSPPQGGAQHASVSQGIGLALGQRDKALAQAKLALPQAPDSVNRLVVSDFIASLEAGKSGN